MLCAFPTHMRALRSNGKELPPGLKVGAPLSISPHDREGIEVLWHAYVDESGDRGWTPRPANLKPGERRGSSLVFSLTAVLVPDGAQTACLYSWERAAGEIGRQPGDVVHWINVKNHGQRKHLAATVATLPQARTISVILCKHHLPNAQGLRDVDRLYNWTLRLLVERLSWFGEQAGAQVAMTFSQVKGMPPRKLLSYLKLLNARNEQSIHLPALKLPPRIDTPANRRMLQIADTASGAVFAAFEPDLWGYTTREYLDLIKPIIWKRPGRPLWKDGLKYGPWPSTSCGAEHPWFQAFCHSV